MSLFVDQSLLMYLLSYQFLSAKLAKWACPQFATHSTSAEVLQLIPCNFCVSIFWQDGADDDHPPWPCTIRLSETSYWRCCAQWQRISHVLGWRSREPTPASHHKHSCTCSCRTTRPVRGSVLHLCRAAVYLGPRIVSALRRSSRTYSGQDSEHQLERGF